MAIEFRFRLRRATGGAPAVARRVLVIAPIVVLGGLVACLTTFQTGPDLFCDRDNPCHDPAYPRCDPASKTCQPADGGAPSGCTVACDGDTPLCDPAKNTCRACAGEADDDACKAAHPSLPRCDAGRCVRCRAAMQATDCDPKAAPICEAGVCRPCATHGECPSKVCLDGACVTADDVAHVDIDNCKTQPPDGSAQAPYCQISDAVSGLKGRRAIQVAGSLTSYGAVTIDTGDVVIVGPDLGRMARFTARIQSPDGGISVLSGAGRVVLDGLVVAECPRGGILCDGSKGTHLSVVRTAVENSLYGVQTWTCDLVVDQSDLSANADGGLLVRGETKYTVTNTFITNNGAVNAAVFLAWNATPGSTFAFNTVADNHGAPDFPGGIDCDDGPPKLIENSIVFGNTAGNGTQFNRMCVLFGVVTGPDSYANAIQQAPIFASNYHLAQDAACCVDAIRTKPEVAPDHDADGKSRPFGSGWDIGAHEFR